MLEARGKGGCQKHKAWSERVMSALNRSSFYAKDRTMNKEGGMNDGT